MEGLRGSKLKQLVGVMEVLHVRFCGKLVSRWGMWPPALVQCFHHMLELVKHR